MKYFALGAYKIARGSDSEIADELIRGLHGEAQRLVVTLNPEMLVRASGDASYRTLLQSADLLTADGTGIVLAARFRGESASLRDRATGVALTTRLLQHAASQNIPVGIVLPDHALTRPDALRTALDKHFPGLHVTIGSDAVELNRASVAILFAAHGAPFQEQWLSENLHRIPSARIGIGVGGTFDFLSGTIPRAPRFMREAGLEWLYRLIQEPKRLGRMYRATIIFPYLVIKNRL